MTPSACSNSGSFRRRCSARATRFIVKISVFSAIVLLLFWLSRSNIIAEERVQKRSVVTSQQGMQLTPHVETSLLQSDNSPHKTIEELVPNSDHDVPNSWHLMQEIHKTKAKDVCSRFSARGVPVTQGEGQRTHDGHLTIDQLVADRRRTLGNILVDDAHKYIYCQVPKISSTQWKAVMMYVMNTTGQQFDEITHRNAHYNNRIPRLSQILKYKDDEVKERLRSYKKFLFVREPLERLLSCYLNKLVHDTPGARKFRRDFGRPIIQKVRGETVKNGTGLTFQEFLQYLGNQKNDPRYFQEHWAPIYHLCHPCSIDYDYIGKFETMYQDSNMILMNILKGTDMNFTFPVVPSSGTPSILHQYLEEVNPKTVNGVKKVYFLDKEIFGY